MHINRRNAILVFLTTTSLSLGLIASPASAAPKPTPLEHIGGYSIDVPATAENPLPNAETAEGNVTVTKTNCVGKGSSRTYFGITTSNRHFVGWGVHCTNGKPAYVAAYAGQDGVVRHFNPRMVKVNSGDRLYLRIRKTAPDQPVDHQIYANGANGWYAISRSAGTLGDVANFGVFHSSGYLPNFQKVSFTGTKLDGNKAKTGRVPNDLVSTSKTSNGGANFTVRPATAHAS